MRYVRKDRKIHEFSVCRLCGTGYGTRPQCQASTCKACNTTQCHSNGLGNGQCSVCDVGLLPEWSGMPKTCSYKGCTEEAVAKGNRKKVVCKAHLKQNGIDYLINSVPERLAKDWVIVDDTLNP